MISIYETLRFEVIDIFYNAALLSAKVESSGCDMVIKIKFCSGKIFWSEGAVC